MRVSRPVGLLAAALMVLATGSLKADTVTANFTGVSPGQVVLNEYAPTGGGFTSAGVFNFDRLSGSEALGDQFQSFCIELTQGITNPVTFDIVPLNSRLNATQTAALQEFWGRNRASVGGDESAAAFQLGVWEITHETDPTYDLDSGTYSVSEAGNAATVAQSWLDDLDGTGPFETGLVALTSDVSQDQVAVLVPAPPAVVMAAFGLVGLVGYGVRRRRMLKKA